MEALPQILRHSGTHIGRPLSVPEGKNNVLVRAVIHSSNRTIIGNRCMIHLLFSPGEGKDFQELASCEWESPTDDHPTLSIPVKHTGRSFAPDLTGMLVRCILDLPQPINIEAEIVFE